MKKVCVTVAVAALLVGLVGLATADDSILVVNPSFQEDVFTIFPGHADANGPITGWSHTGGAGINPVDGAYPFWDNGLIPDNDALAFIQGPGTLTQNLTGFVPGKQYWLQFYVNARSSNGSGIPPGPGDSGIPNASVFFDGVNLLGDGVFVPIMPVEDSGNFTKEWTFVNVPVTPTSESADLMLDVDSILPAPVGGSQDGTLLIDAVSAIQRDADEVVIQNPSFEASGLGVPFPGYQANIAGWNGSGPNIGTQPNSDDSSPFADNGATPDGRNVVFIQTDQSLSQQIGGLVPGESYEISFYYNARGGNAPHLNVTLGALGILDTDVAPVGESNPYHFHSSVFTAANESDLLTFAQTVGGDNTVLLDDVSIRLIPEPSTLALVGLGLLTLLTIRRRVT